MSRYSLIAVMAGVCMLPATLIRAEPQTAAAPALSGWIGEVVVNNPEIQAARAAVEAAAGRLRAADRPLFNPELELEYETSEVDTTTGAINQTIDWSDKRGARTSVAESELQGAIAAFRSKRQRLATNLLQALAHWHTAVAVMRIAERQTVLMRRFARLAEQRRKAGDLGQGELELAHLAAADAAFAQANAAENLIRARQSVTALTGTDKPVWPVFPEQLPDVDPQRVDEGRLLNQLPSLRAAQARVAAARASVRLRLREKRPDPTVGFRAGKEDSETLTGVSLTVPLFVRNRFDAEVDAANADLLKAQQEAQNRRRQARAELMAAAQIYRNAHRAWMTWEESGGPRLGQRSELLDRLWQAGELNTTDYLVQLKQALDTEVSAIEQRGRMWRAWTSWLAASGLAERWLNLAGDGL